jgi:ABC-type transport system involved in multi-copper enzyme maturation permease subunit
MTTDYAAAEHPAPRMPHHAAAVSTVAALAGVVIKELYRRKDFYVLFVLTALVTLVMGSVNFFHESGVVRYLRVISLLLIWISALVIAVATTARQIPAEQENRTIFPLLAKPVTRGEVIVGKFAGCWLACGLALLVFYVFFGIINGSRQGNWPVGHYLIAMWLHWMMLGIVVALVLLGSVVFSAPSANATICLVVVAGILLLGRNLNQLALQQPEPMRTVVYALYFLIPHLEWYDLRAFVTYDHPMPPLSDCAGATVYAGVYIVMLLYATWLVFRRKPLTK